MKFCALSSGSSGNCYFVGDENRGVLIDAGISARAIERALTEKGIKPTVIKGIFVTHEHHDHIKGIATLAKRYQIPVFATAGTWQALEKDVPSALRQIILNHGQILMDDLTISWQSTSHDVADGVFYTVSDAANRVGIMTDTGIVPQAAMELLYDCSILVLEANHDIEMLKRGPYPKFLQNRILSEKGHLSNECCGENLVKLIGTHTRHVVLAHLSETNNRPEIAYQTIKNILLSNCRSGRLKLWVAGRTCGEVLEV